MASSSSRGGMKGFYRQTKPQGSGGIVKPKPKPKPKGNRSSSTSAATICSDVVQRPALISHHGSLDLTDAYGENEEVLRQFDMNMAYGPCIGMSRLARWERAHKLGLNPPQSIERLLKHPEAPLACLWDGRV